MTGRSGSADDPENVSAVLAALRPDHPVTLRFTVAGHQQRRAFAALGPNLHGVGVRQVAFFDTPDLALRRSGVVAAARRTQHGEAEVSIRVRATAPGSGLPGAAWSTSVEVDVDGVTAALTCVCSADAGAADEKVRALLSGRLHLGDLLDDVQLRVWERWVPHAVGPRDLQVLGPVHMLTRRYFPGWYRRTLTAETWFVPGDPPLLDLVVQATPATACRLAETTTRALAARGVALHTLAESAPRSVFAALAAARTGEVSARPS
ncbi:hypothetical protein [Luteimicrobium sp. DT211]|uniref:hypothetical protein n=1 Tax=Luteimicrobium sp. DT211 TaxID=3393412 RepID=UPI003CEDFCD5